MDTTQCGIDQQEKGDYLRILVIAFVIIIVLILITRYLFQSNFLITDRAVLDFLIEKEEQTLYAAQLLKKRTKDPQLVTLSEEYIKKHQENLDGLEKLDNIGTVIFPL